MEAIRKVNEERRELERRVASGELGEEALGPACDAVISDYDLSAR